MVSGTVCKTVGPCDPWGFESLGWHMRIDRLKSVFVTLLFGYWLGVHLVGPWLQEHLLILWISR